MHPLLTSGARRVVGHRGNRAHAPENTIASFDEAVALGVDALELDVRLSRDGDVVVMHDPTVDRTTNGSGAIAQMTWRELAPLDAGHRFSPDGGRTQPWRGRGVGIPRLADVLAHFPSTPLLIEIKVPEASAPLRRVIEEAGAEDRCIVESFHHAAKAPFAGSRIAVGASRRDLVRLLPRALGRDARDAAPFSFMAIPTSYFGLPLPVGGFVAATVTAGAPVHVWTINDPGEAEALWRVGVTGIISDDPAVMLPLRARGAAA
ncbi:MAG: glycerophosphodiester phosphodiesterase [Gemmatimonadetes bacterium]|nr:glycerophosphodiester phosphodiesterase [Gemmatimonadota bacterium]